MLDNQGMTALAIADQLGHARPSMTQDVYMGRRVVGGGQHRSELLGDLGKPKEVVEETDQDEDGKAT